MTESTARANGHMPIERLVDHDLLARLEHLERRVLVMDGPPTRTERAHTALIWAAQLSLVILAVLALVGVIR